MQILSYNTQDFPIIKVLGASIIQIKNVRSKPKIEIIYKKGIWNDNLENIVKMNLTKLISKRFGFVYNLMKDFLIYIYFYAHDHDEITCLVFKDHKQHALSFSRLEQISSLIYELLLKNNDLEKLISFFNESVIIPKIRGILALFVIKDSGHELFSKINKKLGSLSKYNIQFSGFIAALLTIAREMFGNKPGIELKKIDFGEYEFHIKNINKVIFAVLVKKNKIDKLYPEYFNQIVKEFIVKYERDIENFKGDISKFLEFRNVVNDFFII